MTKVEIPFQQFNSRIVFTNVELMQTNDHARRQTEIQLSAFVACENQPPFVYHTEVSWWQMFKKAYFPKWMLNRFPVRTKRNEISIKTIYPFLRSSIPPCIQGDRVQVMVNDTPIGLFVNGTDMSAIEYGEYKRKLFLEQRSDFCPTCHSSLF